MKDSQKYKEEISKIEISKQSEESILKNTIEKKKTWKRNHRVAYACSFIAVCAIVGFSVVHAKEIKDLFVRWSASVSLEDGTKLEISKDNISKNVRDEALKTEETILMGMEEVEEMLGFPVLKLEVEQKPQFSYNTLQNKDGTIGVVNLWANYHSVISENSNLHFSVAILNKNADQSYVIPFSEGRNALGEKVIEKVYTSSKFNAKVVIFSTAWDESQLTAEFVYQNVFYSILGENISLEEMMQLIESLKY